MEFKDIGMDADTLKKVLVGRRIVEVEMGVEVPREVANAWYGYTTPVGRLVLDNGLALYVAGHEGGCSCSAGDYELTNLMEVENAITNVEVYESPDGDLEDGEGVYTIFVFTDNEKIGIATFEGSDGNGYYGTGFEVAVLPMVVDMPAAWKELNA